MEKFLKDKTSEAIALYEYMCRFSEEMYSAWWARNFDVNLYIDLFCNPDDHLATQHKEALQQLAFSANGWWYWAPDDNEPRFLTFEEMDKVALG